jgi:hypothetical protein
MGFLNVDIILKEKIIEFMGLLRNEEYYRVHEIFDGLSENKKDEIYKYINKLTVTDNVQIRREGENFLYVVSSPILAEGPFPQIGVYVGNESQDERGLGDDTGEDAIPIVEDGETVAWEAEYGLWQRGSWIIDIIGTTRDETIWLSRICQYAIVLNFKSLDLLGLIEMDIALQDTVLNQQFQPGLVYSRRLTVRGKFAGTWKDRFGVGTVGTYETGVNLAIEEVP